MVFSFRWLKPTYCDQNPTDCRRADGRNNRIVLGCEWRRESKITKPASRCGKRTKRNKSLSPIFRHRSLRVGERKIIDGLKQMINDEFFASSEIFPWRGVCNVWRQSLPGVTIFCLANPRVNLFFHKQTFWFSKIKIIAISIQTKEQV